MNVLILILYPAWRQCRPSRVLSTA